MKKRKIKNGILLTLSLIATACFIGGGAIGLKKNAVAESKTDIVSSVRLSMTEGASVRYSPENDGGKKSGIRFGMTLSENDYSLLSQSVESGNIESLSFGMLIAPIGYTLTEENLFGTNAIYDWATFDEGKNAWVYNGNKKRIVNIEGGLEDWTNYTKDGSKYKLYTGSLIDIKQENLTKEFQGVGYMAAKVDGRTRYVFATANDNERSIAYTAQKCLEKDNLANDFKDFLQTAYLDLVKNQETSYTVEIYEEGQDGKTRRTSCETKNAKIGATAELSADENRVLLPEQSQMQSVVYANGKTTLKAYYAYKPTGAFDYRILLSSTATKTEKFAAEELQYFYEKATDVSLPIVYSDTVNENGYYISIGNTALQAKTPNASLSAQGESGYAIRSLGNSYLLESDGDDGKIFAVYGFLEEVFGLEIYDEDVYAFLKTASALPSELLCLEKPSFDYRSVSAYPIDTSSLRAWRLRFNGSVTGNSGGVGDVSRFSVALNSHTYFKLLPTENSTEHSDWFYRNGEEIKQICLSKMLSNTEMYNIVLGNLKDYINKEPNAYYFMFGFEDSGDTHCTCDSCTYYSGYNGTEAYKHLYIDATNKLAEDIHSWLVSENSPRAKEVKIGMFAYNDMVWAPETEHKLSDYAYLCFTPIGIAHEYDANSVYSTQYNRRVIETIAAWKKNTPNIMVWNYSSAFKDYIAPFNDIETTKSWLQVFENMGAFRVMTQGARETGMTSFDAFRYYVNSKLMWDTSCDFSTLKSNFFAAYYGDVSVEMTAYYDKIVEKLNSLYVSTGTVQTSIYSKDYFSERELKEYLSDLKGILKKTKNNQAVYGRVLKETMFVRCALLEFYPTAYTTKEFVDELTALEDDAKRCGFTYSYEAWYSYQSSLSYKFNSWKEKEDVKAELLKRKVTSTENYADATNLNYWTAQKGSLSTYLTGEYAWTVKLGHADGATISFSKDILKKAAEQGYTTIKYTAISPNFYFHLSVYGGKEQSKDLLPAGYPGKGQLAATITQELNLADLLNEETGEYSLVFNPGGGWWRGCSMYLSELTFGGKPEESSEGKEYWDAQKDFFDDMETLPGGKEHWNAQKDFYS